VSWNDNALVHGANRTRLGSPKQGVGDCFARGCQPAAESAGHGIVSSSFESSSKEQVQNVSVKLAPLNV
jgi:hypothetical protein